MDRFGAGALFFSMNTKRFLFNQRSAEEHEPLSWGSWGGMAEEGESPVSCLCREIKEEAGFPSDTLMVIPLNVFVEGNGFVFHNFIVLVDDEFIPVIGNESAGYMWADIDTFMETIEAREEKLHSGLYHLLINDLNLIKHLCQINEEGGD